MRVRRWHRMHAAPARPVPREKNRLSARRCLLGALLAFLALSAAAASRAAEPEPPQPTLRDVLSPPAIEAEPPDAASQAAEARDALGRETPRGAIDGFLRAAEARDWAAAARYLDLGRLPASRRDARGEELARALAAVLAGNPPIALDRVSSERAGSQEPGLPPTRERVASLQASGGESLDLLLRRQRSGAASIWLVDRSTLDGIDDAYEMLGARRLAEEHLPGVALRNVGGLALWQWAGLAVALLGAIALASATAALLARLFRRAARRTAWTLDDRLASRLEGPLGLAWATGLFSFARRFLEIPFVPSLVLASLEGAALIAAAAWAAMRLVDLVADEYRLRLVARNALQVGPLLSIGSRVAKSAVFAIAVATALDNAGFDVTALLAGLGIGGIAVALAAQKSLENLFGGITLLLDRPVRIGELCRVGERIGRIEEIGPRSTRFRTLDWTLVTIPNAQLASLQIESLGSRNRMRFHPTLAVRYDTKASDLPGILEALRQRLLAHPRIHRDTVRVQLVGFGTNSINVEVSAYVLTASLDEYAHTAQELLLAALQVLDERGSGLAFSGPPAFR